MRSYNDKQGESAWGDEQRSKWEAMRADLKRIDELIEREEELRALDQSFVEGNAAELAKKAARENGGQSDDEKRAVVFDRFVRVGLAEMEPEERKLLNESRAQAAGDGKDGGYTVPKTFLAQVIESMVSFGGIESVAQILNTDAGNAIEWPTSESGSDEGELVGENNEAGESDVEFGTGNLGSHKLTSKLIRVSNELLADSGIQMDSYLATRIAGRINGELVNLYRVVQNHLEEFVRQFKWALSSRDVFKWLQDTPPRVLTDIQRAARFYYLQQNCFGGKVEGQSFGTATTAPPGLNLLRLEENLSAAHLRLSSAYIENQEWHACIERYDREQTFFYLDPPYWQTEGYGVAFPFEEYERMAELLGRLKGKAIVSLNDHPDIRRVFAGFEIDACDIKYTVGGASKPADRKEVIIYSWDRHAEPVGLFG